jgi:hypothetical protein
MTETEARAIAAPDSWPWPMSREAAEWVKSVADSQKPPPSPGEWDSSWRCEKCESREPHVHEERGADGIWRWRDYGYFEFNRAEHERFMRGLR